MDTYSSTIVREFRGGFQMTVNVYVPDTIIALFTMLDIELDDFVTTIFATIVGGDRVATPNLLAMARNLFLSLEYCRTGFTSEQVGLMIDDLVMIIACMQSGTV